MHAVLTVLLPAVGLLMCAGFLGYQLGGRVTTRRIMHALKHDRGVGVAVLEDLATTWGAKIERLETPGGP